MKNFIQATRAHILQLVSSRVLENSFLELPKTKKALVKSQRSSWKRVRKNLIGTELGLKLGVKEAQTYENLLKLDSNNYDFFNSFVKKIINKEKRIMSKEEPFHFLLTSGSSGKHAKKIPYNKKMFKNLQEAQKQFGASIYKETGLNPAVSNTLNYGSKYRCYEENGFVFGYASGLLKSQMSPLYKRVNLPSSDVINLDDWDIKINRLYDETKNKDLKLITSVPLYLIKIFEDILTLSGKSTIAEIWPNLQVIGYGGTSIDRYKRRIKELIGHDVSFFGMYVASESPIGIAMGSHKEKQFYHFLPQIIYTFSKELNDNRLLGVEELKNQEEYFIHITGDHGLLNYQLRDRVKIHHESNDQIYFEVLGRDEDGLNLATEKIPSDIIDKCIQLTEKDFETHIDHYFLSPYDNKGVPGYHWTFFTEATFSEESREELLLTFENHLCTFREDYKSCRFDEMILSEPKLTIFNSQHLNNYFIKNCEKGQFKMKNIFKTEDEYNIFIKENL